MINSKPTAVRVIPVPGKGVGEKACFGGLLGEADIIPVPGGDASTFISLGGRIPAPWGGLLRGAAVAATLVWVLSFSWGLALLARFTYRKSADALKNGLVLALRTPRAALLTLLLAVLPWAVLTGAPALFFYLLPFWLFVLPGASAWCIARAMRPAVTELEHKNNYYLDREENP